MVYKQGGGYMEDDKLYQDVQNIMSQFMLVHKTAQELLCQKAQDLTISPQQFHLLKVVLRNDGINQKELAKKLKITPATLSVRMKRVEKAGLLIREVDINDKRNFVLKLTKKGEDLINNSHEFMKRNLILMFEGVTNEEIESLKSCLVKIQHNLDRKKEDLNAKD